MDGLGAVARVCSLERRTSRGGGGVETGLGSVEQFLNFPITANRTLMLDDTEERERARSVDRLRPAPISAISSKVSFLSERDGAMLSVETRESHSSSHARSIVTCSRRLPEFACRSRKPVTCLSEGGWVEPRRPSIILAFVASRMHFDFRDARANFVPLYFFFFFFNLPPSQRALSKHDD